MEDPKVTTSAGATATSTKPAFFMPLFARSDCMNLTEKSSCHTILYIKSVSAGRRSLELVCMNPYGRPWMTIRTSVGVGRKRRNR